jgi:hypothetical protein
LPRVGDAACAAFFDCPVGMGVLPHAARHIAIAQTEHARSFMIDLPFLR